MVVAAVAVAVSHYPRFQQHTIAPELTPTCSADWVRFAESLANAN